MIRIDPVQHHPLTIDGERVADVVSLGLRVVLFTTDPRLAALDGKYFGGFDSAAAAVREALACRPKAARTWTVPSLASPRPLPRPLTAAVPERRSPMPRELARTAR
jgi:hypothetical protein